MKPVPSSGRSCSPSLYRLWRCSLALGFCYGPNRRKERHSSPQAFSPFCFGAVYVRGQRRQLVLRPSPPPSSKATPGKCQLSLCSTLPNLPVLAPEWLRQWQCCSEAEGGTEAPGSGQWEKERHGVGLPLIQSHKMPISSDNQLLWDLWWWEVTRDLLQNRKSELTSKKALSLVYFGAPMLGPAGITISTSARSMWPLQLVSSPES